MWSIQLGVHFGYGSIVNAPLRNGSWRPRTRAALGAFGKWTWRHGPTANLIAIVALLAAIVVPLLIDTQAATRDDRATASEDKAILEQEQQGDTLEQIESLLSEALAGQNPSLTTQDPEAIDGPCRSDGAQFSGSWGPERPIYTDQARPAYALINSVRDNPNIGDERSLYGIRDAASPERVWYSSIKVEPGHTYRLRIFIRNDSTDPEAVARTTRVMVNLPTCTGTSIQTSAFVTSIDTYPNQIYGNVAVSADQYFNLAYVEGSAMIENNSSNSPFTIGSTDFLTSKGQLVGFDSLDGDLWPGYYHDVYVSFEIRPQFAPE